MKPNNATDVVYYYYYLLLLLKEKRRERKKLIEFCVIECVVAGKKKLSKFGRGVL